jgi:hypothetical protein
MGSEEKAKAPRNIVAILPAEGLTIDDRGWLISDFLRIFIHLLFNSTIQNQPSSIVNPLPSQGQGLELPAAMRIALRGCTVPLQAARAFRAVRENGMRMMNRWQAMRLTIDQAFAIHPHGPLGETVPAFFQTGSKITQIPSCGVRGNESSAAA